MQTQKVIAVADSVLLLLRGANEILGNKALVIGVDSRVGIAAPDGAPALDVVTVNVDKLHHVGTSDWTQSLTRLVSVVHASHPDFINGKQSVGWKALGFQAEADGDEAPKAAFQNPFKTGAAPQEPEPIKVVDSELVKLKADRDAAYATIASGIASQAPTSSTGEKLASGSVTSIMPPADLAGKLAAFAATQGAQANDAKANQAATAPVEAKEGTAEPQQEQGEAKEATENTAQVTGEPAPATEAAETQEATAKE